jgi:hypothetical protein
MKLLISSTDWSCDLQVDGCSLCVAHLFPSAALVTCYTGHCGAAPPNTAAKLHSCIFVGSRLCITMKDLNAASNAKWGFRTAAGVQCMPEIFEQQTQQGRTWRLSVDWNASKAVLATISACRTKLDPASPPFDRESDVATGTMSGNPLELSGLHPSAGSAETSPGLGRRQALPQQHTIQCKPVYTVG